MKRNPIWIVSMGLAALLAAGTARADTPGEDGVDVIYLMRDCAAAGRVLGTDCFQTVAALQAAIWDPSTGINPTASSPLVVDIGVGDFVGSLECVNGGHVSFRGVGRDHSRILHPGPVFNVNGTIQVQNCENLEFQDLALINRSVHAVSFPAAVTWAGGGSSTWTDVHLEGDYAGWFDFATGPCTGQPIHYFFGSVIASGGNYGYVAICGEHWIYGSEVRMEATVTNNQAPLRRGVAVSADADMRLFGSSIRSHPGPSFGGSDDFIGAQIGSAYAGGILHMHGGIISVAAGAGDAVGIDSLDASTFVHTLGTAFAVNKGTGQSFRLRGPGTIRSPLLREPGTAPPAGGDLSLTGQDLYVETDCDANGCNGGSDPHLMIYSSSCGADPWFDAVLGQCR